MRNALHDYAALRKQMHEALAAQHPEWIEADGGAPMLDLYDARFAELLTMLQPEAERPTRAGRASLVPGSLPRGKGLRTGRIKRT